MAIVSEILIKYSNKIEKNILDAIKNTKYEPMKNFSNTLELCEGILDHGTKKGEGWSLKVVFFYSFFRTEKKAILDMKLLRVFFCLLPKLLKDIYKKDL